MVKGIPPILEVGGILISSDILTECFCCDYEKCRGICCVEGDAGAPVTMDEIAGIEESYQLVVTVADPYLGHCSLDNCRLVIIRVQY